MLEAVSAALARAALTEEVVESVAGLSAMLGALETRIDRSADRPDEKVSAQWLREPLEIAARCPSVASQANALAVLPLATSTRRLGSLLIAFRGATAFDPDERAFLEAVALQVALALERAELREEVAGQRHYRDQLISTLSHELRNSLGSISAVNEAIKVLADEDRKRNWQAVLDRQIAHMTRLVNEMLDYAALRSDKISPPKDLVDVCAVLRDAIEDKRAEAEQAGLIMRAELSESGHWVNGNRAWLTQIFHNLLGNAIKFTPAGGEVITSCRPNAVGGAVIRIADTGPGIEPSLLPRIFEPCSQEGNLPGSRGGLGLGLALVRRLTVLQGGTVFAESPGPGKGATFTLVLPSPESWNDPPPS